MRLLLSLALTLTLAHPATASAEPFALDGPQFARALAVAESVWGPTPCGGRIEYSWGEMPPEARDSSGQPFAAYASWKGRRTPYTSCRVRFNDRIMWDEPMFCTVVVHEIGHLHGHEHSSDPAQVMYGWYMGPVAGCEAPAPAPAPEPTPEPAPSQEPVQQEAAAAEPTAQRVRFERSGRPRARRRFERSGQRRGSARRKASRRGPRPEFGFER